MRLWHQRLLSVLPRQQLLGQHRECCALRGAGWMRRHATVNYVFEHPLDDLVKFHWLVIEEMEKRGYHVQALWKDAGYRGQKVLPATLAVTPTKGDSMIYREHDEAYLLSCLDNLAQKGVRIEI